MALQFACRSVWTPIRPPRDEHAARTGSEDRKIAALLLALCVVLLVDATVLYGYVKTAALEMANKRNGALSSALVSLATLVLLLPFSVPLYRITHQIVGWLFAASAGAVAVRSVDAGGGAGDCAGDPVCRLAHHPLWPMESVGGVERGAVDFGDFALRACRVRSLSEWARFCSSS